MDRRTFSYPISLAVVVATLIAITGGFIAWWNYRTGVDNVRQLAGRLFDQIARETKGETEAFLEHAPPAAEVIASMAAREPASDEDALDRCISVLRANPGFKWVTCRTGGSWGPTARARRSGSTAATSSMARRSLTSTRSGPTGCS